MVLDEAAAEEETGFTWMSARSSRIDTSAAPTWKCPRHGQRRTSQGVYRPPVCGGRVNRGVPRFTGGTQTPLIRINRFTAAQITERRTAAVFKGIK